MRLLYGVGEHNTEIFFFFFYTLVRSFRNKINKIETVRIHFLSEVLDCCHPEILLPWQHDVTTSPLYLLRILRTNLKHVPDTASSSGASFFAYHGRGERETRVTGDEPQGTMGRVQTAGEARCLLPAFLCAHIAERRLGTRLYQISVMVINHS